MRTKYYPNPSNNAATLGQTAETTSASASTGTFRCRDPNGADREPTFLTFWDVAASGGKSGNRPVLSLARFSDFLAGGGFRRRRRGKGIQVVQVCDQVVQEVPRDEIKDFVMDFLNRLPVRFDGISRQGLINQVQREHRALFDEQTMEFLPSLSEPFLRDERDRAFFFFRNGFAEVTKDSLSLRPYRELPGLIWRSQVLDRELTPLGPADSLGGDFRRFLFNVSGQREDRARTLMSAIGYLLHGYKSPSNTRVVVLVDEQVSENPSGGTGKGLVFQAVGRMLSVEQLDGKTFDFRDKFALQGVTDLTRVVTFEDWDGRRLPFDRLFNMVTSEMKVNRLYQGQFSLPYDRSPKLGITTNDMVGGEGDSHARRRFEVEIAPHYSATFSPKDEFGREFFNDWGPGEWNHFDNLMLECCRLFLIRGLCFSAPVNLGRRKLLQATQLLGRQSLFAPFMDGKLKGPDGGWGFKREARFSFAELYREFLEAQGVTEADLKKMTLSGWLDLYARHEGLLISRQDSKDQNRVTYKEVIFSLPP